MDRFIIQINIVRLTLGAVFKWTKWLQRECIGVISYVRTRFRFMVQIRMRQTESVHVAIQNASAHESDRKFQLPQWRKGISWKAIVLLSHRILTHVEKFYSGGSYFYSIIHCILTRGS